MQDNYSDHTVQVDGGFKAGPWSLDSWRKFPIAQQPNWRKTDELNSVLSSLRLLPSLVFSGETRNLKKSLISVEQGEAFIIQAGNCSESFSDCNGPKIHNFLRILLQMSMIMSHCSGKRIVKIGRVAGQYAKPRSTNTDFIDGVEMDAYRGDNVNDFASIESARIPDPSRLLEGYFRSAATLNLIRAFYQGGYTAIANVLDWKAHFFKNEIANHTAYKKIEQQVTTLHDTKLFGGLQGITDPIYVSHEALLLDYEEAFTRIDTTTGDYYCTSAHSLWIGNRTRQINGAHVEFFRGIGNPVGIKISSDIVDTDLCQLVEKVNPANEKGKITIISRMGVNQINGFLPKLIRLLKKEGRNVSWMCDPMHGNTFSHNGFKVRSFDDIVAELKSFFAICKSEGVTPAGVHLEITEEYVSECIGGIAGPELVDVPERYMTKVDPRLNASQAIELSFLIGEMI